MFSFNPHPRFKAEVIVQEPGGTAQTFTGVFQVVSRAETERLLDPAAEPRTQVEHARAWLRQLFVGWEELAVDGTPLPVTDENRDLLLGAPWVSAAVQLAYLREVSGAARKN